MDDSLYDLCLSKDLINEEIITDNLDMAKDYFMEEGIPTVGLMLCLILLSLLNLMVLKVLNVKNQANWKRLLQK